MMAVTCLTMGCIISTSCCCTPHQLGLLVAGERRQGSLFPGNVQHSRPVATYLFHSSLAGFFIPYPGQRAVKLFYFLHSFG